MNKLLFLMICACLVQSCCTCKYMIPLQLSVVAGAGVADEHGGESWSPKVGGLVGVESKFLQYKENSSASAGLNLSFQGAAWDEDMYSGKTNMTYLNVPFLYNYESAGGFYGEAGLQPSFLLSANDKEDGETYDYKNYMHKFDLALPLGVGYKINDRFSIGARVTFGLVNTDNSESDVKDHNFLLAGMLRYTLPINKNR